MEQKLPTDADMLAKIEAFCAKHSIPPTTFGRLAVGDGNLIPGLRKDRSMTLRTGQRVIDFMATYRPTKQADAA
ncbi:hypothetical protein K7W03_14305 [Sphingobium sp. PNB]|uniref:hypothetical protein n=1 Tax=Sphingobium sp. PNB TaxID=863934 RepID=UPI001CA3CA32|nr:hypothetical protein [Sphingobium sp. PNB]MCB4860764.1 hypothetical protein [Sphingobium sp. PNB]